MRFIALGLHLHLYVISVLLIFFIMACQQNVEQESTLAPPKSVVFDFAYDALVEKSKAKADFYQGVRLLNSGNVAESILALQRAVSLEPQNTLIRYWLARAHAAYGQGDFANTIYRELIDANFYPTYLSAALELSQHMARKTQTTFLERGIATAIRAASLDITQYNYRLPMSVRSFPSGALLISALGSNTLSLFNPITTSGRDFVKTTALLHRPIDAMMLENGTIVVSEFASNTISAFSYDGTFLGSFIQEPPPVAFSGPQFLASDAQGNVYVSTAGTARIMKFDSAGVFLLEFGSGSNNIDGLLQDSTGIAVIENDLWVLDHKAKSVYLVRYDQSGNFIGRYFVAETRAESLRAYGRFLLLAGETSVMLFDTEKLAMIDELSSSEFVKISSATFDNNETLWVVDQFRGRLEAFSEATNQYAGLHARLLSLRTEDFPNITARVAVASASGAPVMGLGRKSFVLFEDDVSVGTMRVRSDDETIQNTQVVLVPISNGESVHKTQVIESVEQLVNGGLFVQSPEDVQNDIANIWVVRTSSSLGYELKQGNVAAHIVRAVNNAIVNPASSQAQRAQLQIQAFRMAVNTLLPIAGKKSVLFIGSKPEPAALESEVWRQTMELARYNAISILWVSVTPSMQVGLGERDTTMFEDMLRSHDPLFPHVPHVFYYPYIMQNVKTNLVQRLRQPVSGIYTIAFQSRYAAGDRQYGEKYIALSLETYYFTRSGKDIGGYVIPSR